MTPTRALTGVTETRVTESTGSRLGGSSPGAAAPDGVPALTVVAGHPTAEELAALVVVLSARAGRAGPERPAASRPSAWSARSRLMRASPPAGPGSWRASVLPR